MTAHPPRPTPETTEPLQRVARLEQENAALRAEAAEAREQQTATSEILRVIASSPTDLQAVLQTVAESAARLCDASNAYIYRVEGQEIHLVAAHGERVSTHVIGDRLRITPGLVTGRAVLERRTIHHSNMGALVETEYSDTRRFQRGAGYQTVLVTPMVREGVSIGAIVIIRTEARPFDGHQIALLETFADQAVIAIENTRLFQALDERNRDLGEALEQQTATSEVLKVISRSTFDLRSVLETLVENATRLCGADLCGIYRPDDGDYRCVAVYAPRVDASMAAFLDREMRQRLPVGRRSVTGRVAIERRTVHIPDVLGDPEYDLAVNLQGLVGFRSVLGVPMLRADELIGLFTIARLEVRPFGERDIELVETFADQAAIAMENTRLFQELRERTYQLEDKSAQLELVSKHKSEFLANMSHELRTPLNAIIGFSEVLVERMFGEVNEKQEEYLQDILSSGRHLLSLINDILDLSKVEAGQMELELGEFSLREALENGLTMLKERASRHGIQLSLEMDDALDLVEADERKVKQVVFNLLSNAVKFTPDGGRIDVSARRQDGDILVAVRDTGVGISPEDQERVFEEFRQVGEGAAKAEGTGLGLALTRKLVELHGGRIWLESEVGVGSTFRFSLPLQRVGVAKKP